MRKESLGTTALRPFATASAISEDHQRDSRVIDVAERNGRSGSIIEKFGKGTVTSERENEVCCRRLKRYPFQVRYKQDCGRGFILLLPQAAVLPESDAGSGVIKPASSFVILNRQTSCSLWCPMYKARC